MNLQSLRFETVGVSHHVHLNNAGASLMPASVARVVRDHVGLEEQLGGYEAATARQGALDESYAQVARLVGAQREQIAFTESATSAAVQAVSSLPWRSDDVVLTTRNDYVSNQIQLLSLRKRFGIRIERVPDGRDGGVDVDAFADLVRRHRPRLAWVTHVPTNSGLVQDVESVGSICRDADVLYVVDACQSVGQMPVDVTRIRCDFLAATSRKFLRGPRGAGFLFASERVCDLGLEPLFVDMRGAQWLSPDEYRAAPSARRFERFEFAPALVLGLGEAARVAQELGLEEIRARVRALATQLRRGLAALAHVRVLDRGPELCAIVSAHVHGWSARDVVSELRRRGIFASAQERTVALLDYDEKGVTSSVRLSPHYYNTEDEIDRCVTAVSEIAAVRTAG